MNPNNIIGQILPIVMLTSFLPMLTGGLNKATQPSRAGQYVGAAIAGVGGLGAGAGAIVQAVLLPAAPLLSPTAAQQQTFDTDLRKAVLAGGLTTGISTAVGLLGSAVGAAFAR